VRLVLGTDHVKLIVVTAKLCGTFHDHKALRSELLLIYLFARVFRLQLVVSGDECASRSGHSTRRKFEVKGAHGPHGSTHSVTARYSPCKCKPRFDSLLVNLIVKIGEVS
jgi:hypothetical protein